ncbi:DEAD/DEAH box helicase family protein [Rothia mucilaginosa]|uniref:DEAD/DEAH box helicase n=1 Tax=Rothia mucilaginosa TaxID=43675 RepID=UPI0028E49111|nr:DEAD/DEAH box helicase family protein [Rothia mucilaginosa]
MKRLNISYDSSLLESISANFDLRAPNKEALRKLIFTLEGDYDPEVVQTLNLATGVGKTYLMAAFIEYLRHQGAYNVLIVTPGKTVQRKTIQNFRAGSDRYIRGAEGVSIVVTPQDYSGWNTDAVPFDQFSNYIFLFNIQQLIAPRDVDGATADGKVASQQRKIRRFDENSGVLFDYLKGLDDLVIIADESHLYGNSAKAFNAALKELSPAVTVGLTASPSKSDNIIYSYPLYRAIEDKFVKRPVIAYRKEGYEDTRESEEQQLHDALKVREVKQRYYDLYAQQQNCKPLKAVAFIVCSDVEHASQVATLLRSPAYLDNQDAVLQVDNKHEDEQTQRLLEELDKPHSPVLAVVSVNKLKEGWDVKNIAVVVALRAMASEVLTQQTMGRGLRLPFGKYTGYAHIDQLDIISHQSFQNLLNSEGILQQFGLEEAAPGGNVEEFNRKIQNNIEASIDYDNNEDVIISEKKSHDSSAHYWGVPDNNELDLFNASENTVEVRNIDSLIHAVDNSKISQTAISVETIRNNFPDVSYYFPAMRIEIQTLKVFLRDLHNEEIKNAARRITDSGEYLVREEIRIALDKNKSKLKAQSAESVEVDSTFIDANSVTKLLINSVLNNPRIGVTPENKANANRIVTVLMQYAPNEHWTEKSLDSASRELETLIKKFVDDTKRQLGEECTIIPIALPCQEERKVPIGKEKYDRIESASEFKRGEFYGPWVKSIYEYESFDSYSGEYALANLLDISPDIRWWQRLHPSDNAYIFYTAKDKYFPDFVVCDTDGMHWIVEGKGKRDEGSDSVEQKRRAAQSNINNILGHPNFEGYEWGYILAYEDDIKNSDSWKDLKAKSRPVTQLT